ncbi:MAG: Lin0512 family protein [bacterium]|jgi:uncharacterized protein (TIGR02058 family)
MQRLILELGTGNDLYGEDYTKAACRAVQDAIHHSSLILFRSLEISHEQMQVNVTVGVQRPDQVDREAVARELPRGNVSVTVTQGGLNVVDEVHQTTSVIATVAIEACLDVSEAWQAIPR